MGIQITLYKSPPPGMCHSFHTAKMIATHQDELFDKLRVLWFFIELNIFCHDFKTQNTTEPSTCPVRTTTTTTAPTMEKEEATESMGYTLETGSYIETLINRGSYTSLQYHWRVGRTTICKFVPSSAKPSYKNFNRNI